MINRAAPKGKFRVIGVDTFSNEEYPIKIVSKLKAAQDLVKKHAGPMNPVYAYNDKGECVLSGGTF